MRSASQGLISASPSFKKVMACSMNAKFFFSATPIYSSAIMDSHAEVEANWPTIQWNLVLRQKVAFASLLGKPKRATGQQGDKANFALPPRASHCVYNCGTTLSKDF
jgi:hypothetical protein